MSIAQVTLDKKKTANSAVMLSYLKLMAGCVLLSLALMAIAYQSIEHGHNGAEDIASIYFLIFANTSVGLFALIIGIIDCAHLKKG